MGDPKHAFDGAGDGKSRVRGSLLSASAPSTWVERRAAGRIFALLVALPGPLECGVAPWKSLCSIVRISSSRVTSLAVRVMVLERARAFVWARMSLVASACATLACSVCRFRGPCGLPVSRGLLLRVAVRVARTRVVVPARFVEHWCMSFINVHFTF
jgi:hypothetical protein